MNNTEDRVGAACAFIGCVLLGIGTSMHPMQADPNDAPAAFAEYATDQNWIIGHLLQFVGAALLLGFMLVLSRQLRATSGLRQVATGGAIASLAVAAVLQAIDGIALKALDDWRFTRRMPSRAAAVRELLKRGLAAEGIVMLDGRSKSEDFGVTDGPGRAKGDGDGKARGGKSASGEA